MALSRVHGLLAQARWEGTDLRRLIEDELAPYHTDEANIVIASSPSLSLDSGTAQALALALHELSTNAAKYGALSGPSGNVGISWWTEGDALRLSWTETAKLCRRSPSRVVRLRPEGDPAQRRRTARRPGRF